jgi:hypothetical protein
VEIGAYVVATGEVPALGFGRIPPGLYIGTVLAILLFYLAFITGGWAAGAGDGLFTFLTGDTPGEEDQNTTNWLAVALMAVVFGITLIGRKISRTLELFNWVIVVFIRSMLTLAVLLLTSASDWGDGLEGLFRPALPPADVSAISIGAVAGFAAMASGLNYVFMNYYRDKGYGMGSKAGYLPALLSRAPSEVSPVGTTFRETPENAARWKRWYRYLVLEMWVVFVPGARARISYWWALLVGFLILFSTQLVVFEMLVRNFVDAVYGSSERFRRAASTTHSGCCSRS